MLQRVGPGRFHTKLPMTIQKSRKRSCLGTEVQKWHWHRVISLSKPEELSGWGRCQKEKRNCSSKPQVDQPKPHTSTALAPQPEYIRASRRSVRKYTDTLCKGRDLCVLKFGKRESIYRLNGEHIQSFFFKKHIPVKYIKFSAVRNAVKLSRHRPTRPAFI